MKTIKTTLFVALFALHIDANAATARLSWTAPAFYENGLPLPKTSIAKYEIEFIQQGGAMRRGMKTAKASTNGYLLTLPVPGTYLFRMRTYDITGVYSVWCDPIIRYIP